MLKEKDIKSVIDAFEMWFRFGRDEDGNLIFEDGKKALTNALKKVDTNLKNPK